MIALNETSVLVDASAKQTIDLFTSMALQVVPVNISESSKVYGYITYNPVRITQLPKDSRIFQELDRAAQEGGQESPLSKTMIAENPMTDAEDIFESREDPPEEEVKAKPKKASN